MISNAASRPWTAEALRYLDASPELEIATQPATERSALWTPIWVVVVEDEVFVRTWHRRTTGWYGRAVASARASIRVEGHPVDVIVTATGEADADAIDQAYRAKYGAGSQSMITPEASASTLCLTRVA